MDSMDSMDDATMNGYHGRDVCDMCEGVQSKQIFWINKPHEGPDKYEFDFTCVDFSDGVKRFICKSDIVPQDYWPRTVYIFNIITGTYDIVGSYERNGGYIFVE
jgi:hypothetical protein